MAKIAALSSRSIRYRLFIAVCLMSVIPILVFLNYIFPSVFVSFVSRPNLSLVILVITVIVALGFVVIKQIVDPVVRLSKDAKLIAEGDVERRIEIESEDEIGQLGAALNKMTVRIKENMDELKNYGSRTTEINLQIQKRIVAMSGLLQISGLISSGAKLDDVLNLSTEKIQGLADSLCGFILFLEGGRFTLRACDGLDMQMQKNLNFSSASECIAHIFKKHTLTAIYAKNPATFFQEFSSAFNMKNLLCVPILSRGKPIAILGIGNNASDFSYSSDDSELLEIFGKQVTIAIENDILLRRVEKLEIKDMLTGLYNEQYIRDRLDEEIKRAIMYQRPCGFILAKLNNFSAYQNKYGQIICETALKKVASCLSSALTDVERIARFADYEFDIVLPEKNKRSCEKIAGELKDKVEYLFKDEPDLDKRLSITAAVAENPLDGISAQELIAFAQELLG